MNIKQEITFDLYRYYGTTNIGKLSKTRLYGWQYTKVWRRAKYFHNKNRIIFMFLGWLLYRKSLKYGFQISPQAHIGHGLYIGHFGTVVIGNEVIIGDNCNLSPNVVVGRCNRGEHIGSPIIGNSVWIGSGAVIVGKINIGDNVLIAPNSYVNFDVPDDSIVLGNPGVIHFCQNATKGYIENKILMNKQDHKWI